MTMVLPYQQNGMSPLDLAINDELRRGARLESRTLVSAVVVTGRPVNHVLHLILTILTSGLWIVVWGLMALGAGEQRFYLSIDPYGQVRKDRVR
jgi:CTP-dependent riboflavin kinase